MKKKKSRKWLGWIIAGLVFIIVIVFSSQKEESINYDSITAMVEDVTTYYSFSGNIEAKNKESVVLTAMNQIDTIEVSEGDQVKKDEVLFTTLQGSEVKASIDGEVANIYVTEGDVVTAGTIIMDLTDYSNLQVKVKVDEYDVKSVEVGKEAIVTINALDKEVKGTVSHLSKEAQSLNGVSYFVATIDLNEDSELRVGMSTEVKMVNESVTDVIVIPMSALQFDYTNLPYVYYRNNQGEVMTKTVELGITDGTLVEVISGLEEGEEILIPKTIEFMTPFDMMQQSK
ncbi:MAG: efflux RND transporter periplasmic adaptor subunit [Turicibacter sp.]|nr:efflux RND transporter periplasmic adaptor subunit [Turicibacter sp.]